MTNALAEVNTEHQADSNNIAGIISIIERCALNPQVDVAKMEKLLDMQERILDRNAKQAFSMDFVQMKSKLPKVARTKTNSQTKSKYAALEDINKIIDPILNQYGFGTSHRVHQDDKHVTVTAILWHREGHTEETSITLPLDKAGIQGSVNKTDVHAIASSTTYGKRLAICALLNISTGEDDDGNLAGAQNISESQVKTIATLAGKLSSKHLAEFSKNYPNIQEIKKAEFDTVVARINKALAVTNA